MKNNVSTENLRKISVVSKIAGGIFGKDIGVRYGFLGTYCFGLSVSFASGSIDMLRSRRARSFPYLG